MNTTAALRGWTERGFRAVLCPSGTWLRIRLPSVDHLMRRNVFPHELEAIVLKFTMQEFRLDQLPGDELRDFLGMKDHLIAYMVRETLTQGADPDAEDAVWEPIDLTPFVLELETVLPAEDLDVLGMVAIRRMTPETMTAKSRIRLGVAASIEQRTREEGEAGPTAADFRGVDPDAERAATSADGSDIRLRAIGSPELVAGRNGASGARSGRRAVDRSGSSPAADADG